MATRSAVRHCQRKCESDATSSEALMARVQSASYTVQHVVCFTSANCDRAVACSVQCSSRVCNNGDRAVRVDAKRKRTAGGAARALSCTQRTLQARKHTCAKRRLGSCLSLVGGNA